MSDAKQEHFVPECHLNRFVNDDGYIFVWDKQAMKLFPSRPNDVCNQHLLYETKWIDAAEKLGEFVNKNGIEKKFWKYESSYDVCIGKLLNKVIKSEPVNLLSSDKRIINEYMALLYLRHPITMIDTMNYYLDAEKDVEGMMEGLDYLFDVWEWGSTRSIVEHSKRVGMFDFSIKNGPADSVYNLLSEMHMQLFISDECNFIISSYPMLIHGDQDVIHDIIVPVSKSAAIYYTNRIKTKKHSILTKVNSDIVKSINSLYMSKENKNARFVIANTREDIFKTIKMNYEIDHLSDFINQLH